TSGTTLSLRLRASHSGPPLPLGLLLPAALSAALRTLTASAPSPPPAPPALPARLRRVDPAFLEVTERDDDLGLGGACAHELHDLLAQRRSRLAGHRWNALGVEEHHAGPADAPHHPVRAGKLHHEEVALVVERILAELEVGERLPAEVLEEREVLLAALEGLLHRDHAVPEHSGLGHQRAVLIRSSTRSP